ncbi:3-oxoacyl-ACP reductase FabG [Pseudonocardia halophobica]|uniref:Uncharacterized protein n=1 Tax=Pseudonocardia halophobica TaxID=29401 RepID=A0A9W6P0B3_9PSEU|nr:SDR family oxidoreductase [Pseudonocardia halophobica]GLL15525.1 hypothetical protein GCM10017577_66760 [Pseudonocardia halophobica]
MKARGGIVDVTDGAAVERFVAESAAELGEVNVLVANAGLFTGLAHTPITEITDEEWDRVQAVNVRGVFACLRAVVPGMRRAGSGSIVTIASTSVAGGLADLAHYVASKGAVIALTRAAARELGADGIRVNAVAPGLVASDGMLANDEHAALRPYAAAKRPLARDEIPADLIRPVVFLAAGGDGFVTGQTLVVDGGAYMG